MADKERMASMNEHRQARRVTGRAASQLQRYVIGETGLPLSAAIRAEQNANNFQQESQRLVQYCITVIQDPRIYSHLSPYEAKYLAHVGGVLPMTPDHYAGPTSSIGFLNTTDANPQLVLHSAVMRFSGVPQEALETQVRRRLEEDLTPFVGPGIEPARKGIVIENDESDLFGLQAVKVLSPEDFQHYPSLLLPFFKGIGHRFEGIKSKIMHTTTGSTIDQQTKAMIDAFSQINAIIKKASQNA